MTDRRGRALVALLVAALALGGCRKQGGDPVKACLDGATHAAEARDAKELGGLLSNDFRGNDDTTRDALVETLKQAFAGYDSLHVTLSQVDIHREGTFARATFRVDVAGHARGLGGLSAVLPDTGSYDFDVSLRESDGGWRIVKASWQDRSSH